MVGTSAPACTSDGSTETSRVSPSTTGAPATFADAGVVSASIREQKSPAIITGPPSSSRDATRGASRTNGVLLFAGILRLPAPFASDYGPPLA
jgi:hypothetical protein